MRIQVSRTGGFAGIARRGELDTEGREDASTWRSLAEQALSSARNTPPTGAPDGFRYEITVDGTTVYCADPDLTGAQRTLISRVLEEGA
ncbi:protealysin inhibitor emfourin [Streptomyces sp. NPDC087897]|uniref:protealysin inhibitor emfourin n=1 Tax=Streptomyces sp. NPDC087897 TaxID=3365817 RepID=UPI003826A37C